MISIGLFDIKDYFFMCEHLQRNAQYLDVLGFISRYHACSHAAVGLSKHAIDSDWFADGHICKLYCLFVFITIILA